MTGCLIRPSCGICQAPFRRSLHRRRPMFCAEAASVSAQFGSVFDLAKECPLVQRGTKGESFNRIFEVYRGEATCSVGDLLAARYDVPKDNRQVVVSVRNKISFDQTWFNAERRRKPQNFTTADSLKDPTGDGAECDFCDVCNLTAVDDFGRVDTASVMSGSNLFKYCAPGHGVLVIKKHHPLDFDEKDVRDLMQCTQEWLDRASAMHPQAEYPLFVWNCLARAGASQFHGHAQVMLSPIPFPCYESLAAARKSYSALHPGKDYLNDLFDACEEVGLIHVVRTELPDTKCVVYPSLTPWKDMEVVLWSSSITSPSFCKTLYSTLRILMDEFGMRTFNVGIHGMSVNSRSSTTTPSRFGSVMTRVVSRGKRSSQASDFGGLEVLGGASIGHTDPFHLARAIQNRLQQQESL